MPNRFYPPVCPPKTALTFPLLSLWLVLAISPLARNGLQFVNIRPSENKMPFPPFGKHEELEADWFRVGWARVGWTPSELDNAIWSDPRPTREPDPDFLTVALEGLNTVQETQLSSDKSSHEVEALFWLNFSRHEPFILVKVPDSPLFYSLLAGHQYLEGLSGGVDADDVVLAGRARAPGDDGSSRWSCR